MLKKLCVLCPRTQRERQSLRHRLDHVLLHRHHAHRSSVRQVRPAVLCPRGRRGVAGRRRHRVQREEHEHSDRSKCGSFCTLDLWSGFDLKADICFFVQDHSRSGWRCVFVVDIVFRRYVSVLSVVQQPCQSNLLGPELMPHKHKFLGMSALLMPVVCCTGLAAYVGRALVERRNWRWIYYIYLIITGKLAPPFGPPHPPTEEPRQRTWSAEPRVIWKNRRRISDPGVLLPPGQFSSAARRSPNSDARGEACRLWRHFPPRQRPDSLLAGCVVGWESETLDFRSSAGPLDPRRPHPGGLWRLRGLLSQPQPVCRNEAFQELTRLLVSQRHLHGWRGSLPLSSDHLAAT